MLTSPKPIEPVLDAVRMVRLDLVRQHIKHFLFQFTRILADVQEQLLIRVEAGDEITVLKNAELTVFAIMMQVFAYLEMMDFLIRTDRDREIFHSLVTTAI
jgi:hypothetical protein